MWIQCVCGSQIKDNSDGISYKARYISDQDWDEVMDKVVSLIESSETDRNKLCGEFYSFIIKKTKDMYQCTECGRLFVDNKNRELRKFTPADDVEKNILKSR